MSGRSRAQRATTAVSKARPRRHSTWRVLSRRWRALMRWFVVRPLRLFLVRSRTGVAVALWLGLIQAGPPLGTVVRRMQQGD